MMLQNNLELRKAIQDKRLKYYEVAELIGKTPTRFSEMLRKELPEEQREKILEAIANYE